jgi:NAD(P)-dependent dehydrogenase (short-subunit alcohol dehydrogenase family)
MAWLRPRESLTYIPVKKKKPAVLAGARDGDMIRVLAYTSHSNGLFIFAQKTIPQLLAAVPTSPLPPTLIVTGATASVRGSAKFGTFAAGKFAQRALTQSLAREFGPQGVHVSLAIIDGGIDIPGKNTRVFNGGAEDGRIKPEAVSGN